tara:strand:- start:208 stop:585 length:378 start_codon:yes stop_codon:yes gene_type:complete
MDYLESFKAELNDKNRTPKQMVSFLNGVIKDATKKISKLKGDGKAATVTRNSEDGPQPSTKKDDAKEKKQVVKKAKTLLNAAKAEVKSDSKAARGSRGGGGGGVHKFGKGAMRRAVSQRIGKEIM